MIKFYLSLSRYLTVFLVCVASAGFAQQVTVSGKVTSADDGSPIPGVNVLEKGTSNGSVTDANGEFKIGVTSNATLAFSFVGYKTQEVSVGSQSLINVALEVDVTSLNEVVVVGYGTQEKKDVTGVVAAVGTKDFNRAVIASPQDMLIGKVAGVQITTNNGAPGSGATIRIRGDGSATGSRDPLIVIDGYPVDNNGTTGVANAMATINPNDIETFTVLKDASATAIYGLRAANGVIIITTKKGKEGKPQISYNATVSASSPMKYFDVMSGDQFRKAVADQLAAGLTGLSTSAQLRLGTANTDWQKQVFQTAISHDHNLSVSGTYKNMPYRVSYGYTDQEGILKTTNFIRNSVNVNLNPSFLDGDLVLNATFKGMYTTQNFGNTGAVGSAVSFDPTQPVYNGNTNWGGYFTYTTLASTNPDGSINKEADPITIGVSNPVSLLNQTDNRSNVYRGIGSLKVDYRLKFFPAIKLTLNTGFDYSTSTGHNNAPYNAAWTFLNGMGQRTDYTGENRSRLFDLYANYTKQLNDHKFDVTAGYSYQAFERFGSNFASSAPPTQAQWDAGAYNTIPGSKYYNVANPPAVNYTDYQLAADGVTQTPRQFVPNPNYLVSFFGRVNYSYADKYLLTASFRDDASSRFAQNNRWKVFPSVALGWKIKSESFMQDSRLISDLKLRASYGITGNQDVGGTYPYLALYQLSNAQAQYQFGNSFVSTWRPQPYDPNFRWETTAQTDIGVDFGILDNKISGTIDVYQKKTTDLINFIPVPAGSNFSNYLTTNVGDMENKGIELTLRTVAVKRQDFEWNVGANFTHNENKVTKLLKTNDPTYDGIFVGGISGGVGTTIQNIQVGYPINSFLVYQQIYDAQGHPIEGLYVDKTGKGGDITASNSNKFRFFKPQPDLLIGLNTRINYKKWDFYMQGRFSFGNYVYNNNQSSKSFYTAMYNQAGFFNNLPTGISDTKFVKPQYYSSYYVENASFFKMDNISVGYNLDNVLAQKVKARVGLTVQNAFFVTKYKGLDPEVDGGIDNNIYPRPRTFLLSMNVTF
ncbi:SusC/RagA family TonB-linked outer membrane protein [Cytophagales bacterium WSM2-2]|nr:SusC/RagA family TonB-linked outer membrane protein [Cytophagales bacterium WSM2-2]